MNRENGTRDLKWSWNMYIIVCWCLMLIHFDCDFSWWWRRQEKKWSTATSDDGSEVEWKICKTLKFSLSLLSSLWMIEDMMDGRRLKLLRHKTIHAWKHKSFWLQRKAFWTIKLWCSQCEISTISLIWNGKVKLYSSTMEKHCIHWLETRSTFICVNFFFLKIENLYFWGRKWNFNLNEESFR